MGTDIEAAAIAAALGAFADRSFAVAVSGSSCGNEFARATLCTSICWRLRETAVWEGQPLSTLPRPTDHDGGGDSD